MSSDGSANRPNSGIVGSISAPVRTTVDISIRDIYARPARTVKRPRVPLRYPLMSDDYAYPWRSTVSDVKLGVLCWNQYTDWPSLLAAGQRADRLGFDTLWTWDHLYPIQGSSSGPMFEGWLTLAAWAQATERIRIGLMVGANPFREPTLTAKMATTLDHISGGRAILGIGAAWFEEEHEAFGIEFGSGFPERLRWLGEALPIMRGMLHGERPTASGPRYTAKAVRNEPPPIQEHMPLLVGGGGEQVTLKLVARYADANNVGGGLESVRRKEAVLLQH